MDYMKDIREISDEQAIILWQASRLSLSKSYEKAPEILKVHDSVIGTLGNFSASIGKAKSKKTFNVSAIVASIGKAKSKKTFNVSAIVAAALKNGTVLRYVAELPEDKRKVLYVDTEHVPDHCLKVIKRNLRMAGLRDDRENENLEFLALRKYTPEQRIRIVEQAIYNTPEIGLVIIDGIRDMVYDINSPSGTVLRDVAELPEDKRKVLYVDTEQSPYHCLKVMTRMLRMAGLPDDRDTENLEFLSLRKYTPEQRIRFVEQAIYNTPEIGIVIIDGIRDMVYDINSPSESTRIISKLMHWTDDRQIHIHTILHQNKGDENARGHIGTELINKAETVLQVEKDKGYGDISHVSAIHIRAMDFEPFAFRINDKALPELIEGYKPETKDRQIHIHTILHQNKGDENARGHIGTELNNKAETVLQVEKDKGNGDIRHVSAIHIRAMDF